jgi:hypothetical protein
VWHQRQEELCDRNVGGLWWGIDGDLDGWLSGPSSGTWLSEPVQETGTTGLGMWFMWVSEPVQTWSLEPGLSVREEGHTLRAGSVGNFLPTIKQQGMTPVTVCAASNKLVRTAASGANVNDVQTPRDECCRGLPGDATSVSRIAASLSLSVKAVVLRHTHSAEQAYPTGSSSRQLVQGGLSPGLTPASAYPRDPPTDGMTLLWEDGHTLRAGSVGTSPPTVSHLVPRVQSGGLASVSELREWILVSDLASDVMLQERCHVFCHSSRKRTNGPLHARAGCGGQPTGLTLGHTQAGSSLWWMSECCPLFFYPTILHILWHHATSRDARSGSGMQTAGLASAGTGAATCRQSM